MSEQEQPSRIVAMAENGSAGRIGRPAPNVPRDEFVGAVRMAASTPGGLLTAAWRSRWVILLCTILALGAGVVYVELAVPIYTSTAKLYLDYGGIRISRSSDA